MGGGGTSPLVTLVKASSEGRSDILQEASPATMVKCVLMSSEHRLVTNSDECLADLVEFLRLGVKNQLKSNRLIYIIYGVHYTKLGKTGVSCRAGRLFSSGDNRTTFRLRLQCAALPRICFSGVAR